MSTTRCLANRLATYIAMMPNYTTKLYQYHTHMHPAAGTNVPSWNSCMPAMVASYMAN